MYCPKCGMEVSADDKFCKYCSFELGGGSQAPDCGPAPGAVGGESKSTGFAMLLSVILPGVGAYYIDNNTTGLIVFLLSFVMAFGTLLILFPVIIQIILWAYGLKITSDSIDNYRRRNPLQ